MDGSIAHMATKDLVKRMKSPSDIKPSLMRPQEQNMPEIRKAILEENQTVEQRIQKEVEAIQRKEEIATRSFMDEQVQSLTKQLDSLKEDLEAVKSNMEILVSTNHKILGLLEELNKEPIAEEPKGLKRLFKSWLSR